MKKEFKEFPKPTQDLALLADNLPNSYIYRYVQRPDGPPSFLYISAGVQVLRGVSADAVLKDPEILSRQIDPEQRAAVEEVQARSAAQLTDLVIDIRILRADGEWRWIRVRARPYHGADGSMIWDGMTTDVTVHKQLEAAYRATESRLAIALDHMIEGYQIIDFDFRYAYVNASAARQGQKSVQDLLGNRMTDVYPGIGQTPMFAELRRCMTERTSHRMENKFTYADGGWALFELSMEPVPEGLLIISFDITDRTRLEAELRQAQKMEAIGQLAGGVAHDFNNLLTVILGHGELLRQDLQDSKREQLELILRAGQSAASLTRQLLMFSRRQVVRQTTLNLNDIIKDLNKFLGRTIGEHIQLTIQQADDLWPLRGDRGQLEQVVMNLVVNARDAMAEGGKLTVESANVVLDESYGGRHLDAKSGQFVMLAVSDTGIGMDAATQARIFEPFFTTKEAGRGTGLGLATVYGIVKQSNGSIWVYSELGRGTTFKLYFPRADGAAVRESMMMTVTPPLHTATILVVEDDEMVRMLASQVLQNGGHTVIEAPGPFEAIAIIEQHEGSIELMVTDVIMPGLSGPALAERISPLRPKMKILYMSGYTDAAIAHVGIVGPASAFLQKPFAPRELLKKVEEVLTGSGR